MALVACQRQLEGHGQWWWCGVGAQAVYCSVGG